MSLKNIDKIFRKGLHDSSHAAPDYVWGQISDNLASGRRMKRRVWLSAASVALLLGFGGVWLATDGGSQPQVASEKATNPQPEVHAAEMLEAPSFADSAVYVKDEGLKE